MKIKIDGCITISDARMARKIIADFQSGDSAEALGMAELARAGEFYIDEGGAKIYEPTAKVSYHSGGIGLLTEEENFQTRYPLDIYIELFARGRGTCADIGFYLSDFWQLDGENRDEIRRKAYRDIYTKK